VNQGRLVGRPEINTVWQDKRVRAACRSSSRDMRRAAVEVDVRNLMDVAGARGHPPPRARRTLDGQTHIVKPKALAPVLGEFFAARAIA
jgi:hypothetical protein